VTMTIAEHHPLNSTMVNDVKRPGFFALAAAAVRRVRRGSWSPFSVLKGGECAKGKFRRLPDRKSTGFRAKYREICTGRSRLMARFAGPAKGKSRQGPINILWGPLAIEGGGEKGKHDPYFLGRKRRHANAVQKSIRVNGRELYECFKENGAITVWELNQSTRPRRSPNQSLQRQKETGSLRKENSFHSCLRVGSADKSRHTPKSRL